MISSQLPPDPWQEESTRHGLPADQVISALQKEIRRGNTENAALIAYEMATTSERLETYLWKRLLVISVEDVGFGELKAPVLIESLYRMVNVFEPADGERLLLAIHAVRYLCACRKDRSSDEMIIWIKHEVEMNGLRPTIPDYALDMHTLLGQEMGRDIRHFIKVGAQLSPEMPDRDQVYRDRVMQILADNG
jgi:replication-associated recombination protein RarA